MISHAPVMRQSRPHNPVESTDMHYNQSMNTPPVHNQAAPMASNYYDRSAAYKRKNDYGDTSSFKPDKIMRTASYNMVHGLTKDSDYDAMGMSSPDKAQRHFPSGSSDTSTIPKVFDRHLGSGDGKFTFL